MKERVKEVIVIVLIMLIMFIGGLRTAPGMDATTITLFSTVGGVAIQVSANGMLHVPIAGALIYSITFAPKDSQPDQRMWRRDLRPMAVTFDGSVVHPENDPFENTDAFPLPIMSFELLVFDEVGLPMALIPGFCTPTAAAAFGMMHFVAFPKEVHPSPLPFTRCEGLGAWLAD